MIDQYDIAQIFYTKDHRRKNAHLVIQLSKASDAENLTSNKWIEKVRLQYQINVYTIYSSRLEYQYEKGHPFFEYYCHPSAVIYQKENFTAPQIINRGWKKYHKKFTEFENLFFHDHDIHRMQIHKLISDGSTISVLTSYEDLITYDLDTLAGLYTGDYSSSLTLDQKIKSLITIIPEIEKHFVRKNQNEYFLSELFSRARKAAEQDDMLYCTELFESVGIVEQDLLSLVELRLIELKRMIKKQYNKPLNTFDVLSNQDKPLDEVLQATVERILSFVELEQIYCFHKTIYGETTIYYLLIVGLNIGTDKLGSITTSLKSKFGNECDFVLISHDRYSM